MTRAAALLRFLNRRWRRAAAAAAAALVFLAVAPLGAGAQPIENDTFFRSARDEGFNGGKNVVLRPYADRRYPRDASQRTFRLIRAVPELCLTGADGPHRLDQCVLSAAGRICRAERAFDADRVRYKMQWTGRAEILTEDGDRVSRACTVAAPCYTSMTLLCFGERTPRRRYVEPTRRAALVAWCDSRDRACGQPMADRYCRSLGFREAVAISKARTKSRRAAPLDRPGDQGQCFFGCDWFFSITCEGVVIFG